MIDFLGEVVRWLVETWDGLVLTQPGGAVIDQGFRSGYVWRIWEHVQVSGAALLAATLIALPLGAYFGHTGKGGFAVVSVVNIGRALPSFGIVALALPITIGLADALPFISSGLGFLPTFVALFALALPPIFTNTYAGVQGVNPETVEAARGMGVTEGRILREVELPIASPVILAGIRVSAVQVVATAPLGALVAYGGLGRYIIDGFAIRDDVQIFAGALLVAGLSVITELLFSWVERRVVPHGIRPATSREVRRAAA
jgi:osmoprotectant transport system permease protein